MTSLKDINFGLNQFCGPAVLSALTGKSTDECASVIAGINGRQEIRAVAMNDLIKALGKLRFDAKKVNVYGFSLFATLTNLSREPDSMYIVCVPRHVVAVEVVKGQIYLIDNHTKTPIDASGSARLMQHVDDVYKITAKAKPVFIRTEITLEDNYHYINIKTTDIYENSEDNVVKSKGHIHYLNIEELELIVGKLMLHIGDRK